MKKLLLFIAAITLILILKLSTGVAGVGGSGGGPRAISHVSVEVCDEIPGQGCNSVTYVIRIDSPTTWSCGILQPNSSELPCPAVKGIPVWLVKLNEAYE